MNWQSFAAKWTINSNLECPALKLGPLSLSEPWVNYLIPSGEAGERAVRRETRGRVKAKNQWEPVPTHRVSWRAKITPIRPLQEPKFRWGPEPGCSSKMGGIRSYPR